MHQRQLGALVRTTLFSPVGRALVRAAHADSKQSAPGMWAQCSFENFRANKLAEMSHGRDSGNTWFKYFLFGAVPLTLLSTANAWVGHQKEHSKPRPEFVDYPHLRIRRGEFPWGGNKTLFHNPESNALPGTGYEVEDPHKQFDDFEKKCRAIFG